MIELDQTITINWQIQDHPKIPHKKQGVIWFINKKDCLRVETVGYSTTEEADNVCQFIAEEMKKEYFVWRANNA